jgi:hypothetical protein
MTRNLECHTYKPRKNAGRNCEFPPDFAVIMGTPVGSMVRTKMRDGNTGAHANTLAQKLGIKVLAYQDLGPKVSFPDLRAARYRMLPENFSEYATEVTGALADHVAMEGIKRVALRIHSGNGPLGTQLALNLNKWNDDLRVTHTAISDPAGIKEVPNFLTGFKLWLDYRRGDGKYMPAEQCSDPGQPLNTLPAFLKDIYVRGNIWRTDIAFTNITAIRETTDIATLLYLPGKTFNGTPSAMQNLSMRWPDRDSGNPFQVKYAPEGYPGTVYDSFAANVDFTRRAIDLACPLP